MKIKAYKVFYILAVILAIISVIMQIRICYIYPTIFTAVRLRTMLLVEGVIFGVPALICVVIGFVLMRRGKR